jgi:membrane-bound lytic murein transglycosylase MltF
LAEIRVAHPELKELSWANIYSRPDLQIRAVVFKMKDNYTYFLQYTDWFNAYAFADAGYNGGNGGVNNERRACKISSKCNPALWFGNVELFCLKSKAALYGNRSACDINRHHVKDVLVTRSTKYVPYFK